jgi:hypothetical protein
LINNDASEPYVEYYFNSITLIDDVIRAFDDVIQHERNINNSFKIIHDYGRIMEGLWKKLIE